MKTLPSRFTLAFAIAALALAGCTKKEAEAEKDKAEEKHDDRFVTLTKEQLENVEIKTEVAATGDLDVTLKAAGRVSPNMNKTAKVASTLDGRIAYIAVSLTTMSLMLDGREIYRDERFVKDSLCFDGSNGLHVLTLRDGQIIRARFEVMSIPRNAPGP